MNNEIINALRDSSNDIELDSDGYYENNQEELPINIPGLVVTIVFRIECSNNNVDLIEYIDCYDSNDNNNYFSNQNIEEIESIIRGITILRGGISEAHDDYDPRTKGETI